MKWFVFFLFMVGLNADEQFPQKVILYPVKRSTLSVKVSSSIVKIYFKEGQKFSKDDILAELDSRELVLLLKSAEAELEAKEIELKFAIRNLKENTELAKDGTVGALEVKRSEFEVQIKGNAVKAAKAKVELGRLRIGHCKIVAPYSGKLVKRLMKEHELIQAGEKFLEILDDSQIHVKVHLPSILAKKISTETVLEVKIKETGRVYKAKVCRVAAEITSASRTIEVIAKVQNTDGSLTSGMSGNMVQLHDK